MPTAKHRRLHVLAAFASVIVFCGTSVGAPPANIGDLKQAFETPPDDARMMVRWWWFGPAVETTELEREMRVMKQGGIGGFEVQPVYPLELTDPSKGIRNLRFLSDEFLDDLRFTAEKSRELGLRMDLTLGSGWPYGGAEVPVTEAAGKLRVEKVSLTGETRRIPVPDIAAGERLIAIFSARTEGNSLVPESVREIPAPGDGVLHLTDDVAKDGEILFFIASRTGQMVKRPAIGAEGFVIDHYDRAALDGYLKKVGDLLLKPLGLQPPYAIFSDSLEVYGSDWTGDFLEQFRQRRGYDLKPYLPALVAEDGPRTTAIRQDWGKTLTELVDEHFLAPMEQYAKAHHTRFRAQVYGTPPATLSSNAFTDLPEGEGTQWKVVSATRWASSASHIYGRPVTSSETFTWLHSPVFRATPLDMKAEADLHFLQGINQLIGHGWPYTPPGVEYPGWRFYASAVFDEKNPWWIVMPDVTRYLQRMSYLLRQGKPANDVALYLPNSDAYGHFSAGRVEMFATLRSLVGTQVMPQILNSGYDLDFFDDDAITRAGSVEGNSLVLGGNKYRIVVLPGVKSMPLATLRKLEQFVHAGGILVATRSAPETAPGLSASESEKAEVATISQRLFDGRSAPARLVLDEKQLGATLTGLLAPDVALSPPAPDVGFIHRHEEFAEIYFVANTSNTSQNVKAAFRVTGMQPEWWNPMTGDTEPAQVLSHDAGSETIGLDLEPYGSRVILFSKTARPAAPPVRSEKTTQTANLSTDWKVTFGEGTAPVTMRTLHSWTEDEATRYFSGTATYEKEIRVEADALANGARLMLDFGQGSPGAPQTTRRAGAGMHADFDPPVREAAVVYVNGKRAGSLWCPPYSIDVTGLLKAGENQLRVVVANLALNYMAGHALPTYRLLNLRYGVRFEAQDMREVRPIPAGLLGPIRLMTTLPAGK